MSKQIALVGLEAARKYDSIIFVMVQNGSMYFICIVMQLIIYAIGVVS